MRLLVIDDDPDFRSMIHSTAPSWIDLVLCDSSRSAMEYFSRVASEAPDLAIVDIHMKAHLDPLSEREGLALVQWIHHRQPTLPIVVASTSSQWIEVTTPHFLGFLSKPIDLTALYGLLDAYAHLFIGPHYAIRDDEPKRGPEKHDQHRHDNK